jgi:hypothetical protein
MKLVPYNYPFKTLVNLVIGLACGWALSVSGLRPAVGWGLALVLTAVLYVVLNYRLAIGPIGRSTNADDRSRTKTST